MKIKIGLFFGGQSVEHEVSIISALQAANSFDRNRYDIIPIYITKSNEFYVGEEIGKIEAYQNIPALLKKSQQIILVNEKDKLCLMKYPMKKFGSSVYNTIDVAFPVVHGTNVEDGTLQGYLKTLRIPFVGCDVMASAAGMDKYVMKTILKDNDIPVLDCCKSDRCHYQKDSTAFLDRIEALIGYPVIVKPINLGSSVGIRKADNREALEEALDYAFQFAGDVLVEKAITNLREINCSVLGDYEEAIASECEEPIGSDEILSYEDKYLSGEKSSGSKGMSSTKRKLPADITPEVKAQIQHLAVKTFQTLNCSGVSRIDFMLDVDEDKIWVNEINTIPGSLAFYLWEASGIKYPELLDRMVKLALKRERENKNINYSFDTNILAGVKLGGVKGKL